MSLSTSTVRAFLLACLAPSVITNSSAASGPLFSTPVYPVGAQPMHVITVDVNGDGRTDLVTANRGSSDFQFLPPSISVRLGDGEGGFGPEIRTPVGHSAYWIAAGEFNRDGRVDLVVTGAESFVAHVLLGNGDGTFEEGQLLFPSDFFMPVVAADLDQDGDQDLAFGRPLNVDIALYLGAGDGTFVAGETLPGGGAVDLAVADLDADGRNDLVATEVSSSSSLQQLAVHRGRGDGTFEPAARIEVGEGLGFLALGDLDGDGQVDAAATDNRRRDVSIFLGTGDGSFVFLGSQPVGHNPGAVAMSDLDHDGKMDLVVADYSIFSFGSGSPPTNDILLLAGNGDGTFGETVRFAVSRQPTSLMAADLDGDGDHDLAIVDSFWDSVKILFNVGHTQLVRELFLPTPLDPARFAVGDINGDHHLDLAVPLPSGRFGVAFLGGVTFLLGAGDGTFAPAGGFVDANPAAVHLGDLNGDAVQDLVVVNSRVCEPVPEPGCIVQTPGDVKVYLGDDSGDFTFSSRFDVGLEGPLALGDMNGDGQLDLVAARQFVTVRLGNGDGTFGAAASFPVGPNPASLVLADVDDDGILDVVVGNALFGPSPFSGVSVLKGLGNGALSAEERLGPERGAAGVAVLDFNDDGIQDIAALMRSGVSAPASLTLFPGVEAGGFGPGRELLVGPLFGINGGDLDNDGLTDLIVWELSGASAVVRGGSAQFPVEPLRFLGGGSLSAVHDFDEDGRLDIASSAVRGIGIMLNEGPFRNEPPVAVADAEARVECTSPAGAEVTLDGSGSSDPDSSPGTLDDIAAFDWLEDLGLASERLLGSGQILPVTLSLGDHAIALRVTDSAGETAVDQIVVSVVDTTPPVMEASVTPHLLWPPNHRMVPVQADVTAVDVCGESAVVLESVTSDEEDDTAGPEDGRTRGDIAGAELAATDTVVELRAERDGLADGRVYTLTYLGTDESGNPARVTAMVVVPHDQSGVTDPVEVSAREEPSGTVLEWRDVAGAFYYNVVRGGVGSLRPMGDAIELGELACIESRSTDASSAGHEDAQRPPPGEAYFYLVEYNDGWGSSFGSEGLGLPRVAQGGGCP